MQVVEVNPRGYCFGVVNAINTAKKVKEENPDEVIYILGMIVHNQYVVDALKKIGIITLDDSDKSREELINEIDEGIVILSAHGTSENIKKIGVEKGLKIVDATCKDVIKTQDVIKNYVDNGYDIIYFGKANHPEALATLAINPEKIHLVENKKDFENLELNNDKLFMTNQTTISVLDAQELFDFAKSKYPTIILSDEICNATRIRQSAILQLDEDIDLIYVVGDPKSNNSNKLASLLPNKKALLIQSVEDINVEDLKNIKKVALTSGASTPSYLTNMVIEYLKQFDYDNPETYKKPQIDIDKIL